MTTHHNFSGANAATVQTDSVRRVGLENPPPVPPSCEGGYLQGLIDCATVLVMGANLVGLFLLAGFACLCLASEAKARLGEHIDTPRGQAIVASPFFRSVEKTQAFQDAVEIGGLVP